MMNRKLVQNKGTLSISFGIFLFGFEMLLFQTNYLQHLRFVSPFGPWVIAQMLLFHVGAFTLTVVFVWFSLISNYQVRTLYFVTFAFAIVVQYGYQNAFKAFMSLDDVNTALSTDILDWGTPILAYLNWYALIPIITYAAVLFAVRPDSTHQTTRYLSYLTSISLFALIMSVTLGIHSAFFFFGFPRSDLMILEAKLHGAWQYQPPTVSLQAFGDVIARSGLQNLIIYSGPRDKISFQAQTQPQNNIILIVDESVRGDHLSLNSYDRDTTPYLQALDRKGLIYNWGLAAAAATCSNQSAAMLLTGVNHLPDTEFRIKRNPTIFQYAKKMNYKTFYFEGESGNPRLTFARQDFEDVDLWLNSYDFGRDYDTDEKIARRIAEVLNESPIGNFFLVFKKGLHFPYDETYPKEKSVWMPTLGMLGMNQVYAIDPNHHGALINSYDNGLRYNSEIFFRTLFEQTNAKAPNASVIVYTSDHGQTLGDFGETHPHCKDTKNEAVVPLFIISQMPFIVDEQYKASHHNIFATLLDLMQFPESERKYDYAPSLLKVKAQDSKDRFYLYGSLFGIGIYKVINFDQTLPGQPQAGPPNAPLITIAPSLVKSVSINPQLQIPPWNIEVSEDNSLLWLGYGEKDGLHFTLWTEKEQTVKAIFQVEPGPARSDSQRRVEVSLVNTIGVQTTHQQFDHPTTLTFTEELHPGHNKFSFKVLDEPIISMQPNGDNRPLLVLLRQVDIEPLLNPK